MGEAKTSSSPREFQTREEQVRAEGRNLLPKPLITLHITQCSNGYIVDGTGPIFIAKKESEVLDVVKGLLEAGK